MSNIETDNKEIVTPSPVETAAVPEVISDKELAETEKELEELYKIREEYNKLKPEYEKLRGGTGVFDPNSLGQALANAMQPLIPKPPSPQKLYDQEDWIRGDFKTFRGGLGELIKDELVRFEEEKLSQLTKELGMIKATLPQLYLRAAENPQFPQVDKRAREIEQKYGVEYWKAAQLARDELANQVKTDVTKPNVPAHMSAPDNRATNLPEVPETGPATFADIIRDLRTKHGNNL